MESSKSTDQLVLFEASPATAGNRAWPLFHRKKLFLNQPMIICRKNKFSIDKRDYLVKKLMSIYLIGHLFNTNYSFPSSRGPSVEEVEKGRKVIDRLKLFFK